MFAGTTVTPLRLYARRTRLVPVHPHLGKQCACLLSRAEKRQRADRVWSRVSHNAWMELSTFGVRAGAGTLCPVDGVVLKHAWTDRGVVAGPATNGAQVLHLSIAVCVLNDLYREAHRLGLEIRGAHVAVDGQFDDEWRSTGITYEVAIDSAAPDAEICRLLEVVDEVAEVPRAVRAGASVTRVGVNPSGSS